MNNLMSKKKKYRFQVELRVEELQHVPFLCQELYVKVRLLNGGFTDRSESLMVENHAVHWDQTFKFCSKMTANASTGELDSTICRVSVRQEMKGGRSFQKLGYADVNLAQFAGSGGTNCYLLEAYESKHRLHNSTLRVKVHMTLLSGDPCFKAQPCPSQPPIIDAPNEVNISTRPPKIDTGSAGSIPSLGYNSLDKKTKASEDVEGDQTEPVGHSRNSSNTSGSGYVSNASHSDRSGHARMSKSASEGHFTLQRMKTLLFRKKGPENFYPPVLAPQSFALLSQVNNSLSRTCCCSCQKNSPPIQNNNFPPQTKTMLIDHTFEQKFLLNNSSSPSEKRQNFWFQGSSVDSKNNSFELFNNLPPGGGLMKQSSLIDYDEIDKKLWLQNAFFEDQYYSSLVCQQSMSSNCSTYSTRSGSQGSGGTYSEGGSLERPIVSNRSNTQGSSIQHSDSSKDPRVVSTREDPQDLVNQIFQDTIGTIGPNEQAETSGLQLFIDQDGTTSFGGQTIRSNGELKPIIINKR